MIEGAGAASVALLFDDIGVVPFEADGGVDGGPLIGMGVCGEFFIKRRRWTV